MSDEEIERLSDALRTLSLNIEKAAYELSEALNPAFTSELMELSARLCNAADAVEDPELMDDDDTLAGSTASQETSEGTPRNGRLNGKH